MKEKKVRKFSFFKRNREQEIEQIEQTEDAVIEQIEENLNEPKLEPVDYYEFMETTSKKMENHKARVAGSWGEKRAARMIRDDSITLLGLPSRLEPFYSRSFKGRPCFFLLGFIYAICLVLFLLSFIGNSSEAGLIAGYIFSVLSLVGIILATLFLIPLFIGYPFAQKLLKKKVSYNVLTTIEPKEQATKNLIITSNYDSKFGNNFKISDKTRFWIIAISLFSIAVFILLNIVRLAVGVNSTAKIASLVVISLIVGVPSSLALLLTFSLSKNKVEENNGYPTAIALTTARYLIDEDLIPSNVRVSVVSLGGENAGHDGANAFVKLHGDLFENATVINIGDIVERKYFVATVDGLHKHTFDEDLKNLALNAAEEEKINLLEEGQNFGEFSGYAATAFEKAGAKAVTLLAVDKNPFREITEEADDISDVVKNCFKLTINIIQKILEEK